MALLLYRQTCDDMFLSQAELQQIRIRRLRQRTPTPVTPVQPPGGLTPPVRPTGEITPPTPPVPPPVRPTATPTATPTPTPQTTRPRTPTPPTPQAAKCITATNWEKYIPNDLENLAMNEIKLTEKNNPAQAAVVAMTLEKGRCLAFLKTGAGKTQAALSTAQFYLKKSGTGNVHMFVPVSVRDTFERAANALNGKYRNRRVFAIPFSEKKPDDPADPTDPTDPVMRATDYNTGDLLIVDEIHAKWLSGASYTKKLITVLDKIGKDGKGHVLFMSATPFATQAWELYFTLWLLKYTQKTDIKNWVVDNNPRQTLYDRISNNVNNQWTVFKGTVINKLKQIPYDTLFDCIMVCSNPTKDYPEKKVTCYQINAENTSEIETYLKTIGGDALVQTYKQDRWKTYSQRLELLPKYIKSSDSASFRRFDELFTALLPTAFLKIPWKKEDGKGWAMVTASGKSQVVFPTILCPGLNQRTSGNPVKNKYVYNDNVVPFNNILKYVDDPTQDILKQISCSIYNDGNEAGTKDKVKAAESLPKPATSGTKPVYYTGDQHEQSIRNISEMNKLQIMYEQKGMWTSSISNTAKQQQQNTPDGIPLYLMDLISPKMYWLCNKLVESNKNENMREKVLVYFKSIDLMKLFRAMLKKVDVNNYYMSGTEVKDSGDNSFTGNNAAIQRSTAVTTFSKDNKCRVFLFSKVGGTGIDFKCITEVYAMQLPDSAQELYQLFGRGVRIFGQTHPDKSHCFENGINKEVSLNLLITKTNLKRVTHTAQEAFDDTVALTAMKTNIADIRSTLGNVNKFCIGEDADSKLLGLKNDLENFVPVNRCNPVD